MQYVCCFLRVVARGCLSAGTAVGVVWSLGVSLYLEPSYLSVMCVSSGRVLNGFYTAYVGNMTDGADKQFNCIWKQQQQPFITQVDAER